MNVLSLFDGMSCGQQALERAGIEVNQYFASEIDKYAIQVTMANYPNTIQLGSVVGVDGYALPKIDLLIGGSPCQSFSFAGKRKGMATTDEQEILTLEHYLQLKAEGYEFEGQSYLFWEFMRLLNEVKPKYFLLENVEMGEKWERVLTQAIGVNALHINSALVSAQNRKRIYFTNIGMEAAGLFGYPVSIIQKPKDRKILLKDILESEVDEKYFLSEKTINRITKSDFGKDFRNPNTDKATPLLMNYYKQGNDGNYIIDKQFIGLDLNAKSRTIRTGGSASATDKHNWDLIIHNTMPRSSTTGKGGTGHLSRNDGKTYCLDTGNTNAVEIKDLKINNSQSGAVYDINNKSVPLCANGGGQGAKTGLYLINNSVEVREVKQLSTNNKSNGGTQPYQQDRIYDVNGISPALNTDGRTHAVKVKALNENQQKKFNPNINADKANTLTLAQGRAGSSEEYMDAVSKIAKLTSRIRRLTPLECMRLQTVNDNYKMPVSDSQKYKQLGNGWTIEVISHIFKYIL